MHYVYQPTEFARRIDAYFTHIKGEYHIEQLPEKPADKKPEVTEKIIWDRLPEPALLTGLALHLGFGSKQEMEEYELKGKHKLQLRKARLKIESEYEKRLSQASPTGAIFALRSMGWADKTDTATNNNTATIERAVIIESGPALAGNEKDVLL
ncbi:terminase small subunit [Mucilaginibacter glaciei]|uniref:Uncharacterized protein n=1 Tax=Mucilaginibacter glaciei TaxID=2772109 RepID=A0A926NSM3_9SPHI|nr:terminase small subunit [Mucilaginibacter glaciei]MBD1394593.1 hypothetical protein [Mucilaginibacter glaciei]